MLKCKIMKVERNNSPKEITLVTLPTPSSVIPYYLKKRFFVQKNLDNLNES